MATPTDVEREALPGLRSGDEGALERVFRDQYATLTQEAAAQLDNAAVAPVVVEHAFLQAWAERTHFDTPEALDAFLRHAVHADAARERYRRARLHNLEARGGAQATAAPPPAPPAGPPPTADEAWRHVQAALHKAVPLPSGHRQIDAMRHEAAEHVATLARRPVQWSTIAVALVVGAIVTGGIWRMNSSSAERGIAKALAAPDARILSARSGQRAVVTLLDGSEVTLGPESRLVVPPRFGDKLRAVRLEGTASFKTAPGKDQPLDVRAGNVAVTATGTQFDVSAYPGNAAVIVRVREGQVAMRAGDESHTLGAGRALAIALGGATHEPSARELDEALAWTDGRFVATDQPLREVLPRLQRWYALNLQVRDSSLLDRRISMAASLGSAHDAITALEQAGGLALTWDRETMVLQDAKAAPPATKAKGARKG